MMLNKNTEAAPLYWVGVDLPCYNYFYDWRTMMIEILIALLGLTALAVWGCNQSWTFFSDIIARRLPRQLEQFCCALPYSRS